MATKKKKAADKKPASRRKQIKQAAPKKTVKRSVSPARELNSVRTELRKARRPLYSLNKKIKNAPSKYYERKFKKERKEFLATQGGHIEELAAKRDQLKQKLKVYDETQREKKSKQRKVSSLEKRIREAVDDQDIEKAEKLRYELLKYLGEIDKLNEELGILIGKKQKENLEAPKGGGGAFVIDKRSPYGIWEAIKQLHSDVDNASFKYYIVNGKRFSVDNPIEITAEASAFWIVAKKNTSGTPYIDRYINFKTNTVKYIHRSS